MHFAYDNKHLHKTLYHTAKYRTFYRIEDAWIQFNKIYNVSKQHITEHYQCGDGCDAQAYKYTELFISIYKR